jgi:hypothetical protein
MEMLIIVLILLILYTILKQEEIKLTTYNLTKNETIEIVEFWKKHKKTTMGFFINNLYDYINNSTMNDCNIDISENTICITRKQF